MIYTFCTVPQPSELCPFTYPSYGLWSCPTKGLCSKPTQYLCVMAEVEMTQQHPILRGLSPGCVSNPSTQLAFKKPDLFLLSPKFCRRWVKIFYLLLKVSGSLLPTVYILSPARIIAVVSTLNLDAEYVSLSTIVIFEWSSASHQNYATNFAVCKNCHYFHIFLKFIFQIFIYIFYWHI